MRNTSPPSISLTRRTSCKSNPSSHASQSHLRIQVLNYDKLQPEEICELTQFALTLADKLALYKLPASLKQANEQERQKLEEIKQKDEKMKKIEVA